MSISKNMNPSLRIVAWIVGILFVATGGYLIGKYLFSHPVRAAQVGVVDIQLVLQTPKIKEIDKKFSEILKPQQETLLKSQQEYIQAKNNFKKNERVMSESARKKQEEELAQRERVLQEKGEKLNRELMQTQAKFSEKFQKILAIISQKNKIDILLQKGAVLHTGDKFDVTSQVIDAIKNIDLS